MDHVAILNKSWNLIPKLLSGEKKIESRWYKAKFAPWNKIKKGDFVYFKDAGMPITAKAKVEQVIQYENYSERQLAEIIDKYHGASKICFVNNKKEVFSWAKNRKHCILIFLKNPKSIKPFNINKKGFGNAAAWLCVKDINRIKL